MPHLIFTDIIAKICPTSQVHQTHQIPSDDTLRHLSGRTPAVLLHFLCNQINIFHLVIPITVFLCRYVFQSAFANFCQCPVCFGMMPLLKQPSHNIQCTFPVCHIPPFPKCTFDTVNIVFAINSVYIFVIIYQHRRTESQQTKLTCIQFTVTGFADSPFLIQILHIIKALHHLLGKCHVLPPCFRYCFHTDSGCFQHRFLLCLYFCHIGNTSCHLRHYLFLHTLRHLKSRNAPEHRLGLFHCCLYCGFLCRFCHILRTLRGCSFFCHIRLLLNDVYKLSFGFCRQ